jgi:CubicO group peptidase (beta-lactamase class C family)
MDRKRVAAVLLWLMLFSLACQSAEEPVESVVVDPAELQAFADAFFPEQMEALHIPGLVFVLVQAGEVIYARGYGLADLEASIPMDAGSSVVRIGSVSKTFVATAVMQLAEAGQLDLHTDVNDYLTTFQLEDTYSKPVTLAHLLTHTAGFEDPPYVSNTDPSLVEPLSAHLAAHMPPRGKRPGKAFLYSNYGYALAALIVEEVSGMPFDQYVAENIFQPLGMTRSQYLVTPPVPENMATGYFYEYGVQLPQPLDYDNDYPGGSIVTTAEDMARFMLAHLQGGCVEGACILQSASLAGMHQPQVKTPHEGQSQTHGFIEGVTNDVRMVGHGGAIRGFAASLNLLLEHDLGVFFAFNEECWQTSACDILGQFRQQFTERFFQ